MPLSDKYTQRLGLADLDVYLDTPDNDNTYFNIINLPQIAGYGKHSFQISYNDPDDTDLLLRQSSGIVFELVDANGETIFSELSDIPDASGAASGYFWIKKDPLWLAQEISDGEATLYIVGELDNVPEEFVDTYNVRTAFTFDIRKTQPNTSRILFYDVPGLEASSSVNGSTVEFDKGSSTFARGYLEVSASHMETHGGQVNFIELSYLESGSRTDEFIPLVEYPLQGSSSRYELEDTSSIDGLNPISHVFKTPVPRDFRRDTQAKFRLRFLDANKSPAKYYDEIKNDQIIEITSSFINVSGTPFIIEKEDNLLAGSMFTGNAVGKGFEQSGKDSAFLKTVDYTGFKSASLGLGSPGVMFFSGSVLPGSGDEYDGVGLELFGTTESFFRYRTDPSILDIRTDAFFVGSENTQFISASGGIIQISSSRFHLQPDGDVFVGGTIEAETGKIGGFHISESRINSANEKIIFKSSGQISASSLLLASGSFVVDPDNLSRFGSDGFQSFVMAENTGVIIQTSNFNLNTARFIMSSSDVGVLAVGSTPPLDFDNGTGFYVDGDGNFLVGKSTGPRIQFDGFQTTISSSNFFLGSGQQFVSGSLGNVEISSSNFHLDADGNVNMAGTITATAGEIGGFSVSADALSSDNFFISGAATNTQLFISSSGFSVDAQGVVSASDLSLQGGSVGGLSVEDGTVSVGEILKFKESGQITGSQVLFTGGKISGSNLDVIVPRFFLGSSEQFVSGSEGNIEISSSNFHLNKDGSVNMSGTITATAGKIAGWTISGDTLVGNNATLDGAGAALFRSDAGPDTDNSAPFDILRDEYYIDFSPADQGNTRNYYVKFGPNFAVDSDGVLHASGAQFEGTVSASKGIIGGFTTNGSAFHDNNNQIFISGSPAIGGTHHPKHMFISSSNFNVKQSGDITGSSALFNGNTTIGGTLDVIGTGTIAGFGLTTTAISSSNNNLILRSNGKITGSEVFFNGGKIGGFVIDSDEIKSTGGTMILDSDTRDGTIALGATPNINVDGTNAGVYMNGLGDFLVRVNANNFIKIDQDASTKLDMKAETFFLGAGNQFISGSNGTIAISSSNFDLDTAGNVTMAGTVTATAGQIAGFTISGNSLTATNFEIDASGKRITLGNPSSTDLFVADADEGIQLGNNTFGLAPFSVTKAGVLKAVAGTVGGYGISATAISSSNNNLILKNSGQITGSTVLFTGGKIGGFTIDADEIKSTNLLLDSNNEKITVGSANAITIQGGGTDNFIVMGSKTAFAQTSTAGVILGMDNNVPSFDLTRNASNYVRFDTSTGVDIKTDTFKLDTSTLDIDSSTSRIQVVNGSSNEVVRLGEISDSASDLFGLKVYDGSGTADANTLVKLGGEGNTIGGWTITNDQIRSLNLVIHSSGRLETADFASGVKGWRISSEGNGQAEFENATIRGTLSTAVFEKETVNAVGGQLYVANSTVISGSGITSASNATMSVENVSGFVPGEIASLKKISDTGFSTEYIFINSASRNDRSSDTDFSGNLFVIRGYSGSLGGETGSLGGTPNAAQDYNPGQVLVSTGRIGTGYIRLNANPNDSATPYIDIVERTGSAIYDIELKTRVGDLSGLSSATLFGEDNPGFGIFTENGFFKGGINATTGSFTGVVHINTSASEIMKLGTNVSGTNDGIFVNNNNFLFTDGQFKTGNANNFISHDGIGNVKIVSENFTLKGGAKLLMTSESLAFDTSNATTATRTAGTGVFMDVDGNFRVGNSSGNRLTFTGTSLELVTDDLNIDTSTFDLSTDGTGKIALGATPPTGIGSGTGFFVDGAGNFLAGNASGNFIRFNQSSGAVQVSGEITITAGALAGVTKDTISGSAQSSLDALEAGVSASIDNATGSLSSSLATAIGDVSSSAGLGISKGNSATAAASTAQSAIDDMETQVVLNSGGMDLRNESNLNLVSYGTNTKFFDGVGQTDGHMKLRLNTDGVFAFANTTESFARFYNEGVQLVSGSVEFAKFAGVTTIGNTSTEHVRITDSGLELKDGSTVRLSMNSSGMQIGSVSKGITLNSSGDATFNGAITISPSDLPAGTVSGSAQLADAISGSLGDVSASLASGLTDASSSAGQGIATANAMATQVVLNSNGMSLKSQDTSKTLASFGTTVVIGENADDKSRMVLDNDSLDLIVDAGGTDTTHASFGATTTIGPTATEHVEITSTSLKLKDGSTDRIIMNSSGVQIGAVSSGITLNSDGDATFNGVLSVGLQSAISGSNNQVSGALAAQTAQQLVDSASMASSVQLTNEGLNILKTGGSKLAEYGTNVFVGLQNSDHVKISTAGLEIKDNNTVVGKFTGKGAILGNDGVSHISASTLDVHIKKDDNNKAVISADGLKVVQGGTDVADFGSTVVIGEVGASKSNVQITSGAINLRSNTTNKMVLAADGSITIGNQFSVNSDGDATFGGTLTIGGLVSGSAQLADAISGSSNAFSASAASSIAQTAVDSASVASSVQITNEGLNILNSSNDKISEFGANVFVGLQNAEHVKISSAGLELKDNNTVVGKFVPGGATIGDTSKTHISASTTEINILQNGKVSASFGTTTTIGSVEAAHTFIDSGSFRLKDGNDVRLQMDAKGLRIGNQFSVDSSGNATFGGTLTVAAPVPTGTVSSSAQLADAISGSSNDVSASLAAQTAQQLVDSASVASAVQITNEGLNILRADNGNQLASYGTTTTIGSTSAEHISISSDAIEIKTNATTTVLSASSAGLDMSGRVTANSGEIAGLRISNGKIFEPNNTVMIGGGSATDDNKEVIRVGSRANVGGVDQIKGFFASGSGFMRVGSNIGQNLTFDPDVGLTVSSSNFNISAEGNVTMSGNISAAGGDIAGLVITPTQVSKGTSKTVTDISLDTTELDHTGGPHSPTDNLIHTFTTGDLGLVSGENAQITGFSFVFQVTDIANITSTIADNHSIKLQVGSGAKTVVKQGIPVNVEDTHTVTANVNFPIDLTGGSTVKFYITNPSLTSDTRYYIEDIGSATLTFSRDPLQGGFILNDQGHITGSQALFTGGKIGTFTLSSDKLESDATNTKRGIKLEPGKSIRGYGNEVHTTVSRQGGFSFATGAVVSSATGINPFITTKPPQASGL